MAPRVKTQEIDKRIAKGKEGMAAVHQRHKAVSEKVSSVLGLRDIDKMKAIEFSTSTNFEESRKNQDLMKENIAILVHGLDEVTQAFGSEFAAMSKETVGEKFIGIFSKKAAAARRSDRVKNADISGNLEALIEKSDVIVQLLREDLTGLENDKIDISERFKEIRVEALEVARERTEIEAEMDTLVAKRSEIDGRLRDASGQDKIAIETEVMEVTSQYNELKGRLETSTALAQSFERYSNQFSNHLSSLDTQIAAQNTLIDKISYDSQQRALLYRALSQSIKTARQQEVGHQINRMGVEVDAQADAMMSNIGMAASNAMADMLETHKEYATRSEEISRKNHDQRQEFERRFSDIVKDMESRKLFLADQ